METGTKRVFQASVKQDQSGVCRSQGNRTGTGLAGLMETGPERVLLESGKQDQNRTSTGLSGFKKIGPELIYQASGKQDQYGSFMPPRNRSKTGLSGVRETGQERVF